MPLVGIPLIADQLDNVMKAVHRGFGLAVSPKGGLKAKTIGTALKQGADRARLQESCCKALDKVAQAERELQHRRLLVRATTFLSASVRCMHTSSLLSSRQTAAMYWKEGIWSGMCAWCSCIAAKM